MSDILNIQDPGLRPNERPGSRDLVGELQEKFPFEAFKTDDPSSSNPVLYLEDPWRWSKYTTVLTASDDYSLSSYESVVYLEFTRQAASKTITLDATILTGQLVFIKAIGAGAGAVVLDGSGSQTIDGSATLTIDTDIDDIILYSDGSNWKSIYYTAILSNRTDIDTNTADIATNTSAIAAILTSYDTGWINRSDWTNVHMGNAVIDYDNLSGTFTVGETITEEISGNTGVVVSDSGSVLVLSDVTGTGVFTNDRKITGGDSGATADVNGDTKNTDENVRHGLNTTLDNLLIKILASTDGTDANSLDITTISYFSSASNIEYGVQIYAIDNNTFYIQTGSGGAAYIDGSGQIVAIDTEDWYYKIKIWKLG